MDPSRYNDLKSSMKTGDIILFGSDSLVGKTIQWITRSQVNHAAMVIQLKDFDGADPQRYIMEALEHGTVLNRLSKRLSSHNGRAYWYRLNNLWADSERLAVGRRLLDMVGIEYDYWALFKNAVMHVTANPRALFCSEYCYLALGYKGKAPRPNELPAMGIFEEGIEL